MMKKILNEVVEVIGGQAFKGSAAGGEYRNVKLIQIAEIKEKILVETSNLSYANIESGDLKINLKKGDVIMPLRGARHAALLYDVGIQDILTTTPNQVAILRSRQDTILPIYLFWYLNTSEFHRNLNEIKTGTAISHISINRLKKLKVEIPSLECQKNIGQIYNNWLSRKLILNELLINGEQLAEAACFDAIKRYAKQS